MALGGGLHGTIALRPLAANQSVGMAGIANQAMELVVCARIGSPVIEGVGTVSDKAVQLARNRVGRPDGQNVVDGARLVLDVKTIMELVHHVLYETVPHIGHARVPVVARHHPRAGKRAHERKALAVALADGADVVHRGARAKGLAAAKVILIPRAVGKRHIALGKRAEHEARVEVVGEREARILGRAPGPSRELPPQGPMVDVPVEAALLGKLALKNLCALKAARSGREKALHAGCGRPGALALGDDAHAKVEDVGVALPEGAVDGCKGTWHEGVILVEKEHVVTSRREDAIPPRAQGPTILGPRDQMNPSIAAHQGPDDIGGVVFAHVVRNDDLNIFKSLRENARETLLDMVCPVVGWHDHRKAWHLLPFPKLKMRRRRIAAPMR